MSSRTNTKKRKETNPLEYYPTDERVVKGLLACPKVSLPTDGPWLEPCAGDGAIIRATTSFYGKAAPRWDAVEISPTIGDPLRQNPQIDNLYFEDVRTVKLPAGRRYRVAITNPPFSIAGNVLAAVRPLADYTVMLIRVGWVETMSRYNWLSKDMPDQGTLVPRPSFSKGSTDSAVYAWMIWGPDRRDEGRFFLIRWKGETTQKQRNLFDVKFKESTPL